MRGLLQHLFCKHYGDDRSRRGLSTDQRRAIRNIQTCRTAAQGTHLRLCPNGDYREYYYNSCKHRSCPRCGGFESARWADRQQRKALPCRYYHIVFTLPQELNVLWRFNRSLFTHHFFTTAWAALHRLYRDPQWVGGRPGALAVFQSWGETLNTHPHLHVLITAGGLTPKGGWQDARQDYLLPTAVLRSAFRGRFLEALRKGLFKTHTLQPPPDQTLDQWSAILNRLALLKWHIQIQPPYRHPNGLILYLAYYLRGGPISEHRLHAGPQGIIQIDYKRPSEHQTQRCSLPVREFLARFLTHIPPRGLRMARSWGLFHPRARVAYAQALTRLKERCATPSTTTEVAHLGRSATSYRTHYGCPRCGAMLIIQRQPRAPPQGLAA